MPEFKTAVQSTFFMPTLPSDAPQWAFDLLRSVDFAFQTLGLRADKTVHEGDTSLVPPADGSKRFYFGSDSNALLYDNGQWYGVGHKTIYLGMPGYTTLEESKATICDAPTVLVIPPGVTVVCDSDPNMPWNIGLNFCDGSKIHANDGVTVTLSGPIKAPQHSQIFSWDGTGKFNVTGSTTSKFPIQWWGALAGLTNDCTAAFNKASQGLARHQHIHVSKGEWRITSAVTLQGPEETTQFSLMGDSYDDCLIYIDINSSTDAITCTRGMQIADISFTGPNNCCKNVLTLKGFHHGSIKKVQVTAGANQYAINFEGSVYTELENGQYAQVITPSITIDTCLILTEKISVFKSAINICLRNSYFYGISLENSCRNVSFENVGIYSQNKFINEAQYSNYITPLMIYGSSRCALPSYGQAINNLAENVLMDRWTTTGPDGWTTAGTVTKCGVGLVDTTRHWAPYCAKINTNGSGNRYQYLNIQPDVVDQVKGQYVILGLWVNSVQLPYNSHTLWMTPTIPVWAPSTAYKVREGVLPHASSSYMYRCVTPGTSGTYNPFYMVEIEGLTSENPCVVTWTKHGLTSGDKVYIAGITQANWSNLNNTSSGYVITKLTDDTFSIPFNAYGYPAYVPGTDPGRIYRTEIVDTIYEGDGTVKWVAEQYNVSSAGVSIIDSTNLGTWIHLTVSGYIPLNTTALNMRVIIFAQDSGGSGNVDCYIAEPTFNVGAMLPGGLYPTRGEFYQKIKAGGNQMTWGSVIPTNSGSPLYTQWAQRGDVHWYTSASPSASPGWVCTTSGMNNSGAVWKAMANLAA